MLICIENTHANAGGIVVGINEVRQIKKVADTHKIPMHLDGARIFNAAVALNKPISQLTADFDSIQLCLSKGLSAPVGSILVGSHDFIKEARHYRKMLGGGMRQCGIIAAAGMVALTKMIDRLQEDHDNAYQLAEGLNNISGFMVDLQTVQTNIVLVNLDNSMPRADELVVLLYKNGVRCLSRGPCTLRFLLHRHITSQDVSNALKIMEQTICEYIKM